MNLEQEKKSDAFPKMLGKYRLLKTIGKGGMGEIFLAEDPSCIRTIALKKILPNLLKYPTIKKRFLREAQIAAQLAHPAVIPIYSLHIEEEHIYYTMPYVEGETLKEILKETRKKERAGELPHPIGSSVPTLIQIFLQICQALDYTHAKGFVHRDLKPENIMIGQFGEVLILDWGIAHSVDAKEEEEDLPISPSENALTKPGKVVGTVNYMAPERALGASSSVKTDIYSLGILLYQILTLRLPFRRKSLADFRKTMYQEVFIPPEEIAPHRDIPWQLSHMTQKALSFSPDKRYESVREMIDELKRYIEGYPEWIPTASLHYKNLNDWEFQENVLLTKQLAITRISSVMEWVMLMISKETYSGNTYLETSLTLDSDCLGMGFLMCIPKANERKGLEDGYCLWIGSEKHPGCKLFRSNVEVIHIPDIGLAYHHKTHIAIEKVENHFRLFIDGALILTYFSHIPLLGGHIGLLYRDADFSMEDIQISLGSQNVMVNCLAIPDAFFMNKDFKKALSEYRRIAHCFRGRLEGREALFRGGITLLEEAKNTKAYNRQEKLFNDALNEFEKLGTTSGAPLEYLGKALVYEASHETDEEMKCLELALRKFPRHPLLHVIQEHIHFRLHDTSKQDRYGAYSFLLLILRLLPNLCETKETQDLINNLTAHWEPLPFITPLASDASQKEFYYQLILQLAFWLSKPLAIYEVILKINPTLKQYETLIENIFLTLLEARHAKLMDFFLAHLQREKSPHISHLIRIAKMIHLKETTAPEEPLELLFHILPLHLSSLEIHVIRFLIEQNLSPAKAISTLNFFPQLFSKEMDNTSLLTFKSLYLWSLLLASKINEAEHHFASLSPNLFYDTSMPFQFLYGCFLSMKKGEKAGLEHFDSILEMSIPTSFTLLNSYLKGKIQEKSDWMKTAFPWEKIQLFRQLALYFHCLGKMAKAHHFEQLVQKEYEFIQKSLKFI